MNRARAPAAAALLLALALGACAGSAPKPAPARDPAAPASVQGAGVFGLAELPPQRLASGQCGLVLWSREPKPRRLLLALNSPPVARILRNGAVVELAQTGVEGRSVYGHHPVEHFAGDGLTLTLRVSFEGRQTLSDGAIAREGSVELSNAEGWSEIIPAAGLIGCQP